MSEVVEVDSVVEEIKVGDCILHFSGHAQYDYLNPEDIIKIPGHISSKIALCTILGEDMESY